MAITSKRGKKPLEKSVDPTSPDVEQIEINFAEFDDHPINKDGQQEFEYYKEDWVIQHRQDLFEMDPRFEIPSIGHMKLEPRTNVVSVWDGKQWLTFDYYHLQNLLRPKTRRVTMGQHEYEVVTK